MRSPRRWYIKPCMDGVRTALSSQPTQQEWTVYLHWFCPVKYTANPQTTSFTRSLLLFWGITEPFVLWDKMTKGCRLFRLLRSRLESCKVGKLPSSPFKPWRFFFIRTSRSAMLCQDAKCRNISSSAKKGVLQHFLNHKTSVGLLGWKRLYARLVRVNIYMFTVQ